MPDNAQAKEPAVSATPELLYEYKGYNIVRARGLYVAVAQDADPMDVGDVLANSAPRPPAEKFIIAHDTASLEAAVDAHLKDTGPTQSGSSKKR